MRQAVVLKLEANPPQHQAVLETLEAFNRACQAVADLAFEHRLANKIALQPLVYNELRARYGLSSQMAVRAISKACEVYKHDKSVHVRFDPHDPMILDPRLLSFRAPTHISLLCLSGRQYIPFRYLGYTEARPDRIPGQADLMLQDGVFLMHVCIDLLREPTDLSDGEEPFDTSF